METYFFILGLANSLLLIAVFLLRKRRIDLVKRFGWIYLLLAIPTGIGIFLGATETGLIKYEIFLALFLAFLFAEWFLDFVLKVNFREDMKANLKYVVPYLCLYYASNYGFIVMPWSSHVSWGIIMAALFGIQFTLNLSSHPKPKNKNTGK